MVLARYCISELGYHWADKGEIMTFLHSHPNDPRSVNHGTYSVYSNMLQKACRLITTALESDRATAVHSLAFHW
jgi:hypothetical protein